MKSIKISDTSLGCLVLIGLVTFSALILRSAWSALSSVNVTLAVGTVAGVSTILVSVISLLISKHFEQKTLIENEHRKKKIPIYEELMAFIFKTLMAKKLGNKQPTEKETTKFMSDFTQKAIVWGADDVVDALYNFKQSSFTQKSDSSTSILFAVEDLLFSIRKDLGHKNKNLSRGKLLGGGLKIEVQHFTSIKCCTSILSPPVIKFPLSIKNYDDLRADNILCPRYLLVLLVPEENAKWVEYRNDHLILRNTCYWVSIRKFPEKNNTSTVTVDIPLKQKLTKDILLEFMQLVSEKGYLS